jgi:hypothetical protein
LERAAHGDRAIFQIGRTYCITTGVGEEEGYSNFTVVAYEAPLLRVEAIGRETVFNTSAASFIKA